MNVMHILERIKRGERVMVTLPTGRMKYKQYDLTDGTEINPDQFEKLRPFLTPVDAGLFSDAEPQSYVWGG
ncbi:hypothetical protein Q5Y75_05745 [Ruegeria sp. 2205SS24-7]|uniref:hypothetical protein n=1 Tax=Ruegeria discodermiae TaxID=3064389 RepID=UPI00274045A3|nr:hypothetical protein [Ruegeria sp. 2205SS24-7]MDP5216714.1 hypothetical protein [Ruegeria sp. 2205SS24-7]